MNRRKLLCALGATGIAVGMGACNSDQKADSAQSNSNQKSASPKPVAKDTPSDCPNTPIPDQSDVDDLASILMVVMLSVSQKSLSQNFKCARLEDDLFQDNGNSDTTSAEAIARWGFNKDKNGNDRFTKSLSALKAAANAVSSLSDFHKALNTVHNVFLRASGYTGPDCPGPVGIKTIVSTAVNLGPQT